MRGIWHRLADDEGMTLIEIMVSAAIMFIILTGVLSLVLQTTMMGLQAKQKNLMTNALNAYIEWVHTLPFDQVALVEDGGVLQESEQTSSGYAVVINPIVQDVNSALKDLIIDITLTDPQGRTYSHTTRVSVRDRTQFLTQAEQSSATRPSIEILSLTPPEGAVVWGSWWGTGSTYEQYEASKQPLYIDIKADAVEERVISGIRVSAGGLACVDAADPPNSAVWLPGLQSWSSTALLFTWNTAATEVEELDDGTTHVKRLYGDGMRTMKIWAIDDLNGEHTVERYFLVDNFAPPSPTGLTLPVQPGTGNFSWNKTMDGDYGADSYRVEWARQGMSHTNPDLGPFSVGGWGATAHDWPNAATFDGTVMSYPITTEPFSRYAARVRAQSPRMLLSEWSELLTVTRPRLGGDYVVVKKSTGNPKYWRVTANLTVTPPTFPVTGTTTYTFYRVGTATPIQTGTSNICTHQIEVSDNPSESNFPVTSYRVDVSFTPAGYAGGASQTLSSNTVTTTYRANADTYTLAEGTW